MKHSSIPERKDIPASDRWNLSSLYSSDEDWERDLSILEAAAPKINAWKERVAKNHPEAGDLLACLRDWEAAGKMAERLGNYAFLQKASDESDARNTDRVGRFMMRSSALEAQTSWFEPAIQAIDENLLNQWKERPEFADFRVWIEKRLRWKPYILSEGEERILALQTESRQTPKNAFSALTNVDLDFGNIATAEGDKPLTQSTWSTFMESQDRELRKTAYTQFYAAFDQHKNTIANLYAGSVNQNVAAARIRGYPSARAMHLFPDRVPEAVYDNLIGTIRSNLAPLHRYYALRKQVLSVEELRHYDVYVPLVASVKKTTSYDEAVNMITDALSPLGSEYTQALSAGLLNGWVDRYENKGKRSGAFSSGGFSGDPYILMNYKEDVLRDVFTLAHEGGHSMHTWYSARSNPFPCYDYTIFEAEVASTFNEDLLFRHLLASTRDRNMKAYLLSTRASDILATLYRQTMFAEFEKRTHELVESGTPLGAELLRSEYRSLLEVYFGSDMHFEETSDLECLRIPHFYNAFYVYKYATGISASLALAERVCSGGEQEKKDYFAFLSSGGSRYPIDALRVAGVDMEQSAPVEAACKSFEKIIDELENVLTT